MEMTTFGLLSVSVDAEICCSKWFSYNITSLAAIATTIWYRYIV